MEMVEQLKPFADERLLHGCTYCDNGAEDTRDHVPSRLFLDTPLPENLPVVPACFSCNNGFSRDEEYLACLIECAMAGSTDPAHIQKANVAGALKRSPALRARLDAAKSVVDGKVSFAAEDDRVRNVLLKLARGHAAFELNLPFRKEPSLLMWWPRSMMTDEQRDGYDAAHVIHLFGELGSRGMQRLMVTQVTLESAAGELSTLGLVINDWVDVQEGRYRYQAIDDKDGVRIKIVIAEFLACEVAWGDETTE